MKARWRGVGLAASALLLAGAAAAAGADAPGAGFEVIALGVEGGGDGGNLSTYLVRPAGDARGVTCDAGTLLAGLGRAHAAGTLDSPPGAVLKQEIKAYLVSHAHLDHVAGLMLAAPDDAAKPVYALGAVNAALARDYFNWSAWPNFSDRGEKPLRQYRLTDLAPGVAVPVEGTAMRVTAWPLSHGGVESAAFLIESGGASLLCLGDTGPDAVETPGEKAGRLAALWQAVAPELRAGRLRAIIIEASYDDARPDPLLFGHLTPRWLAHELRALARAAGMRDLNGLPVIVTHVKPDADDVADGSAARARIAGQLAAQAGTQSDTGARFILPEQGQRWVFGPKEFRPKEKGPPQQPLP